MKLLIIGQNPSSKAGSTSLKNLYKWMDVLEVNNFSFTNVSTFCTPNNRPLKSSEYQLNRLSTEACGYEKIIALGKVASKALKKLNIDHFCLPHPSGLNRQLNNKEYITKVLFDCNNWINCY